MGDSRLASSSCLFIPPSCVCFAFGGIGCSAALFLFLLWGFGEGDTSHPRPHFFDYLYAINKRIMQSTHSLQLKQTPPVFFSREIFVIVYLLIPTSETRHLSRAGKKNHRVLVVFLFFPFSFLIDDRLVIKRFNDLLFKS